MQQSNWDYSYQTNQTPWREEQPNVTEIIQRSGIAEGAALDLGCGTGEWGIALAKTGFEVEGLDFSAEALKIARSNSGEVIWTRWDLKDLDQYGFQHLKYDLIIDQKVLAFIQNKEKYLDTIRSILNGVFVLTVFHEHDEKPAICVPINLFHQLIPARFYIIDSEIANPRPGKVYATYFLRKL